MITEEKAEMIADAVAVLVPLQAPATEALVLRRAGG